MSICVGPWEEAAPKVMFRRYLNGPNKGIWCCCYAPCTPPSIAKDVHFFRYFWQVQFIPIYSELHTGGADNEWHARRILDTILSNPHVNIKFPKDNTTVLL